LLDTFLLVLTLGLLRVDLGGGVRANVSGLLFDRTVLFNGVCHGC
jgi:hypothetical protein